MVAGRGAGLPPRLLGREARAAQVPVVEVGRLHGFGPSRQAGRVSEEVPYLDALLAAGGELGPVAGDGRVQIELASVGEDQRAQGGHGHR